MTRKLWFVEYRRNDMVGFEKQEKNVRAESAAQAKQMVRDEMEFSIAITACEQCIGNGGNHGVR